MSQSSSWGLRSETEPSAIRGEATVEPWRSLTITMNGRSPQPPLVHNIVRGLLNKLTMARFDPISDKIIALVNMSERETDGRTLYEVVRLIFEAAANQEMFSEMYACLCGKVVEKISPNVRDDGILDFEGRPVSGGRLFRKHLINRCLEDFERSWVAKEDARIAKAAVEQNKDGPEGALPSDECYAVQKAKRQGLGLIKFIGELFKLQMLTERVVHDFVKRLLGNVENPAEEEVEGLCKLLTTVGQDLDTPKASAHMVVYFSRIKEMSMSPNISLRMHFMLDEVMNLHERKWVPRDRMVVPETLDEVHAQAAGEEHYRPW